MNPEFDSKEGLQNPVSATHPLADTPTASEAGPAEAASAKKNR